jgi:hypothetical protein
MTLICQPDQSGSSKANQDAVTLVLLESALDARQGQETVKAQGVSERNHKIPGNNLGLAICVMKTVSDVSIVGAVSLYGSCYCRAQNHCDKGHTNQKVEHRGLHGDQIPGQEGGSFRLPARECFHRTTKIV